MIVANTHALRIRRFEDISHTSLQEGNMGPVGSAGWFAFRFVTECTVRNIRETQPGLRDMAHIGTIVAVSPSLVRLS
jgi:hypothetical protein